MRYQLIEWNGEEKFFNTREDVLQYMIKNYVEDEDFMDKEDLIDEYQNDLLDLDIESSTSLTIYDEGYENGSVRVYDTTRQRYDLEPIRYMKCIEYYTREELLELRDAIDERLKEI